MTKPTKLEEEILREHFPSETEYNTALCRMNNGEALAYIVGEWFFYGLTFKVTKDTLIPRPDTEMIVDFLISHLPENAHFADMGTGSGCIALSVLANRKDVTASLFDISKGALDTAKQNAELLGVGDRCTFALADMRKEFPGNGYDAVVSNPPYIRSDVLPTLSVQVKSEPQTALDGGIDGLDFYRALLEFSPAKIKADGFLLFEIGYDQRDDIIALANSNNYNCKVMRDYGGNDRMAYITPNEGWRKI